VPLECGVRDAVVAAVVATVSVEVPEPPATEAGLNEHVGIRATTGVTLQVRLTALLKPFCGAIVIVEVAEAPAETVAGASAVPPIVKSGPAVTVKVSTVA
jgi:hypothetical protein